MISVFDLFKIGIGPSSSHTVGPMVAANLFLQKLGDRLTLVQSLQVTLYGSLSSTGKGHATDTAVLLGLLGHQPQSMDTKNRQDYLLNIYQKHQLKLSDRHAIIFDVDNDIIWQDQPLAAHPNGLKFMARLSDGQILEQVYYSVGGGFIKLAEEMDQIADESDISYPYDFGNAQELSDMCQLHDLSIAQLMMANETTHRSTDEVNTYLNELWQVMQSCVTQGCKADGILPGGLKVKRRAKGLYEQLSKEYGYSGNGGLLAMDWVNLYALAVNEENASGGRVVTAPTNGAAGIIPAVLHYYRGFIPSFSHQGVREFLLVAGAIGALIKQNASISGAEVGCQGEVGSACAMAAAGLAHVLGGSVAQCLNAAEIGLEHNLGLTCDPVAGLVQVPCIERNAMASVKAINAARLALRGDGSHYVSLDEVIKTMKETGMDMMDKYKETAKGGLAIYTQKDGNKLIEVINISGFSQC